MDLVHPPTTDQDRYINSEQSHTEHKIEHEETFSRENIKISIQKKENLESNGQVTTALLGSLENHELIVVNLPMSIDRVNPTGEFIQNIKKELCTDKVNIKLQNFETKFWLNKKSKLGTVCREQVYRNKKTGEIKKKYKILD
jgi:hypothetical protein